MSWGRANHTWCVSDHSFFSPSKSVFRSTALFPSFERAVNDSLHLKVFQQQEQIPLNLGSRKLTNFQGKCNSQWAYYYTLLLCIVSLNVIYTRVSTHLGANTLETKFLFLVDHSFSQGLLKPFQAALTVIIHNRPDFPLHLHASVWIMPCRGAMPASLLHCGLTSLSDSKVRFLSLT